MIGCSLSVHKTSSPDTIRKAHRGCLAMEQRGAPRVEPREHVSGAVGSWPLRLASSLERNQSAIAINE